MKKLFLAAMIAAAISGSVYAEAVDASARLEAARAALVELQDRELTAEEAQVRSALEEEIVALEAEIQASEA